MEITRRQVLQHAAALSAASMLPGGGLAQSGSASEKPTAPRRTPPTPPLTAIAMHRIAFGPSKDDLARVREIGFEAYVKEQLSPTSEDSARLNEKLATLTLPIEYEFEQAGKKRKVKEDRALKLLNAEATELWPLRKDENFHYEERLRPLREVQAATALRAVYSKWQLREVMVDFWHNHFNVNAEIDDQRCRLLMPIHDRLMRQNALGNFRQLLEAVTRSGPMLYYLNNAKSKASPANENFARELFELHTLGADAYLNHLYGKWRDVPGAPDGKPIGYIDQDVYEAARAFTGWTIADGEWSGRNNEFLPDSGEFLYYDGWHDPYQKRVLGVEFDANQPPMADGKRVLDLVSRHPATAKHLCTKLCRRFVSDNPPASLVDKAVRIWNANHDSPRQIALVMETIILSPEFKATWGQKVKRPLELVASFIRGTNIDFTPNLTMVWLLNSMGQRLFSWPTPTGHPDRAEWWLTTAGWLQRWNMPYAVMWEGSHLTKLPEKSMLPATLVSWRQLTEFYCGQMFGYSPEEPVLAALTAGVSNGREKEVPTATDPDVHQRCRILQVLISLTPEYQMR